MTPPPSETNYHIVWSDDFSGPQGSLPNQGKWNLITRPPTDNNEKQTYTNHTDNVSLSGNGLLYITPRGKGNNFGWTSARLEGWQSFACPPQKRMMFQAELRTGMAPVWAQKGIWPAFWALGQGKDWPRCGEWDIMENSRGKAFSLASVHYAVAGDPHTPLMRGGLLKTPAQVWFSAEDFHVWAIKVTRTVPRWQDESLQWFLDGKMFYELTGSDFNDQDVWNIVAHGAFFPILNVAVGTNFPDPDGGDGADPDDATASGLQSGMQVKYVAVYMTN